MNMVEKEKIMEDIRSGDIVKLTVQSPRIVRSFKKYLHLKEEQPYDLVGYVVISFKGIEISHDYSYLDKTHTLTTHIFVGDSASSFIEFEDILSYTVLVKKYPS